MIDAGRSLSEVQLGPAQNGGSILQLRAGGQIRASRYELLGDLRRQNGTSSGCRGSFRSTSRSLACASSLSFSVGHEPGDLLAREGPAQERKGPPCLKHDRLILVDVVHEKDAIAQAG